ncbi:MAG: CDP-archaeol synthase [Clostridiales bacterium]|jgi:CDP-diglyceride synthetase|nr:CDP-archaeol synthase [Bacillota bacterium]NLK04426.1 CDP-archaeol synthase [Clostridiales bacterium]
MVKMLITAVPIVLSCIANTFFLRSSLFLNLKRPIDGNRTLSDGRRLFGNNKTWRGLLGMVFLSPCVFVLWGLLCKHVLFLEVNTLFYTYKLNKYSYNILIGFLIGLAYCVFELPNSFIKRRIGIDPGGTTKGWVGIFFVILDQVDSLFGCAIVIYIFNPMHISYFIKFIMLGGIIHITLSYVFKLLKLRKRV